MKVSGFRGFGRRQRRLIVRRTAVSLMLAAMAFQLTPQAQGAPDTWIGDTTALFSTGHWSAANPPASGDSLFFGIDGGAGLNLTDDLAAGFNIGGITFNANASAYVIGGTNQMNLTGPISNLSSSLETLNINMATTAVQTVTTTAGGGDLILGGIISGTGGGLTLAGGGALTLSNANTYTGNTTVAANTTLNFNNAKAIGTGTLVINGGTLDNTTAAAITNSNNNAQTWAGDFTFLGTKDLNLGTGAVSLTGNRKVTVAAGNLTVGGVLSGTANLTVAGAGQLILNGANTYIGNTTISGGTVKAGNAAAFGTNAANTLFVQAGGTLDVGGQNFGTLPVHIAGTGVAGNGAIINTGAAQIQAFRFLTLDADATIGGTLRYDVRGNTTATLDMGGHTLTVLTGDLASNYFGIVGTTVVNPGNLIVGSGGKASIETTTTLGGSSANTLTVNSGGKLSFFANTVVQPWTLDLEGGTVMTASGSGTNNTLSGPVLFNADTTFDIPNVMTLTGAITGSGALTKISAGPLTLSGNNTAWTGQKTVTAGSLVFNGAGAQGTGAISLNGGSISLLGDGNGQYSGVKVPITPGLVFPAADIAATYTDPLSLDATSTIVIGRVSAPLATNKVIVSNGGLTTNGAFTLTVTNNNGYGLDLTNNTVLTVAAPTFTVANASISSALSGLIQDGILTGTVGFTKAGNGTMELNNSANDFTGNITITGGVLAAASGGAIGNAANGIILSGGAAANVTTLRATGDVNLSPTQVISLNSAFAGNNAIEVVAGKTLTVNSPFGLSAATNTLTKNDDGTLRINANNSSWTGVLNINSGAVLIDNNALTSPLGTATVNIGAAPATVGTGGAALQLSNGVTITGATLNFGGGNQASGMNFGGGLESVSGTNTWAGIITATSTGQYYGADAGATLNLNPSSYTSSANSVQFVGAGTVNINFALPAIGAITKYGTGLDNLTVASPLFVAALTVNSGTWELSGGGTLGSAAVANTITSGGTLKIDDTGTAVANRLSTARTLNLSSATFDYVANAAGSSESIGALTSTWGANTIEVDPSAGATTITFASLAGNAVNGGSDLIFKAGPTGTGTAFGTTNNKVIFTTAPTLSAANIGIIQRGLVLDANGINFATYNTNGLTANTNGVQALLNYNIPTISSTTTVGTTVTVADTSVLSVGMAVFGPNIPAGDTIASITSPTTYTLTTAASVAGTVSLTYGTAADTSINSFIGVRSAGDNVKLGSGFIGDAANTRYATRSFGSLYFSGPGTALNSGSANGSSTYTLTSGNILSTGAGTNTIGSGAIIAAGATETALNVAAGNTLAVNGSFSSAANVTKALDGTVSFNAKQFFNTGASYLTINGGTVILNGGNNTLYTGVQGGTSGQLVAVGPGGTLDLNGTAQLIGELRSPNSNAFTGSGGTVTSATAATLVDAGDVASNFGGQITGNIFFAKGGTNALNLYNDNTFTGGLLLMGGTTQLIDSGRFSGLTASTPININGGALAIINTGTINLFDRVPDAAPIFLRAGSLNLTGRNSTAASETLGAVTLVMGNNQIGATNASVTGITSTDLVLTSLTHSSIDAVTNVNVGATTGNNSRILITTPPTLVNNLLPTWIESSATEFTTYIPGVGIAPLSATGSPGYDGTALPAASNANGNYRIGASGVVATGGLNLNSLVINGAFNVTFGTTTSTDVLNLTSGGLLKTSATGTLIGSVVDEGRLTAGGTASSGTTPFYVYDGVNGVSMTINSRVIDNPNGALVRLILNNFNGGTFSLTDANTYTGGTVVNGWIGGNGGGVQLNGATGAVVLPGGGLTLTNGILVEATNGGQINSSNVVTLNGSSSLTLVAANTLNSLVFNNNGGATNPAVASGGVLSLTNSTPISVTSSNPSSVATVSGTLDFGGAAKTLFVDATTVNSIAVAPLTAGLNISALIQNTGTLTKTGGGNLQLSNTANAFGGGVNLTQGGIIVAGNSTAGAGGIGVLNGPLGTGTLTAASGTSLISTGAFTLGNTVAIQGDLTFNGINNLTLSGATSLTAGNNNLTVVAPQMTASLNGVVSGAGSSITKNGLGTLSLGNVNTFNSGVTLNAGTLLGTSANPFGTGTINMNGGLLAVKNNSGANYGNNVVINSALTSAFFDVNSNGVALTNGNPFVFGALTSQPTTVVNVSGGNFSAIQFTSTNLGTFNTPTSFSPAAGITIILPGGFTDASRPVNVGQGVLALGGTNTFTGPTTITGSQAVAAQANAVSAPFGAGNNVILAPGSTLQVIPTYNLLSSNGYTQGGLAGHFFSYSTAPVLNTPAASGQFAAAVIGGLPSSDQNLYNHPPLINATGGAAPVQDIEQYTGLLNIASGGTYNFEIAKDDEAAVFIDGFRVVGLGDGVGGAAGGFGTNAFTLAGATGSLNLAAGLHQISILHQNGAGGSGFQLFYNGPDTASTPGAGWQNISINNLYYNTSNIATAGNGYLNAAQINDNVVLNAGTSATLDGGGSQRNSTFTNINLGNASTLFVTNNEGTSFIGATGTTTVGTGVTINTTSGMLYLIGGVTDSGNGLTKAGSGSLILGASPGTFTGALNVQAGSLVIADPAALTTGTTTIGNATATTVAAGNTVPAAAALATFTVTVTSTAGLFPGEGVTGTGVGAGAYIVSITDATHYVAVSAAASTAGTPSLTYYSGATLDLNGITNVTGKLVLNGSGPAAASPTMSALGNSSATPATFIGTVGIGAAINGKNPSIGGYGDIAVNGAISDSVGGQAWTKIGPDIVTLGGNNSFTGALTVNAGILKLGSANALGTSATNGVTFTLGSALDLNGQTISAAKLLTFGAGNLGVTGLAINNTLGALINNAAGTTASYSGAIQWTGALGIGSSSFDAANPGGNILLTGTLGTAAGGIGINKVGQDTLTIQGGIATTTGGTNIQMGTMILSGAAGAFTGGSPVNISSGATLKLDNSLANLNNRLGLLANGGNETINGNLTIVGNAAGTQELISTAAKTLAFANSGSIITLQPDAAGGLLFNISSNTALSRTAGATSLFRGAGLGTATLASFVGAANPGVAGFGDGTQANPGFSGTQTGITGTNRGILAWALVDTTNTGTGTSFAAYDTTNGFRALNFATDGVTNLLTANTNVLSTTGVTTVAGNNTINSLTLNGGGATLIANSTLQLLSGGILDLSGSTATPNTISGPGFLSTNANAELIVHTPGTAALNISSLIAGTTGGLTKADAGTLILSNKELYTGNTIVNGGTLKLNGGNQTIYLNLNNAAAPGATGTVASAQVLQLNQGGTLDLNGNNQMVANLNSANPLPNTGGVVTNTGALATFQTVPNGNQTFAGSINGNLNFIRTGGFTFTLETASNFNGSTTIQGGQTILQDLAAFTGTSAINLNGGALTWTDTGTQAVANRLPVAAPLTFNTGAFTYNARNGVQGAITIGNATFNSGSSLITVTGNNGTANLTIGNGVGPSLTHNVGGTVTFNSVAGIGDNNHVYLANQPLGFIGAWATAYQNDAVIGQSVQPSFAVNTTDGVNSLIPNLVTISTGNVITGVDAREAGNVTLPAGGATLNTLSVINTGSTVTFAAATDTLTITTGGLLTNIAANIGATAGSGRLTAGSGVNELFLHSGAGALTINSVITDNGVAGGFNVVADPMAGNGTLVLTAANTYLGTTYLNAINTTLNAAAGPAISGNLVITGGVSTTDSTANTTTFGASNQIATTATVTLKGGATLNLAGFNNTIANLNFDNTSGDLNGTGGTVLTGLGTLTVSGNIATTANTDPWIVPQVNGFLNLTSATPTISAVANPINPQQMGLDIAAVITLSAPSTTPLTLTGGGVIALNGQNLFTNGISVTAGTTLAFGPSTTTGAAATFGSAVNSQVNLASGAFLDTRGLNAVIGSLTGTGTVTNTAAVAGTLTEGADNRNSTFAGALTDPTVLGLLNLTKIGTGTLTLTADNSGTGLSSPNLGTLTVSAGGVTLSGPTGLTGFTTESLQTGGTLTLDNSANAVNNRLGGAFLQISPNVAASTGRTLNMQGGTLNIIGNATTAVSEGVGTFTPSTGGGSVVLNSAGTAGVTLAIVNLGGQAGQSSLLIKGDNLGLFAPGTANNSNVTISGTYAVPGTQGAGAVGTTFAPIRPDIIGTDTVSGNTEFVFKDTNGLRPLNQTTELQVVPTLATGSILATSTVSGSTTVTVPSTAGLVVGQAVTATGITAGTLISSITDSTHYVLSAAATASSTVNGTYGLLTTQNAKVTATGQNLFQNTSVGSLSLFGGGTLGNGLGATGGNYGPSGLQTLTIGSAGILAQGGTSNINVGAITSAGTTMDIHVVGPASVLNLNSSIVATTNGIVKSDDGTLSINAPQYFTGAVATNGLTINGSGKVILNGGANTILVAPTAGIPTLQALYANSGTLDLNGNSQAFERISSIDPLPGQGTNITSTAPANLFTVAASNVSTTLSGSIGGAISFYKEGAGNPSGGTLTLTTTNGYTGTTNILGGTLALRDSGALTGTSGINVNYAQLTLDNTGLSDSTSRITATVPVTLSGGTVFFAAGQAVESQNIGTVTLAQGLNQISIAQYSNNAQTSSSSVTVGNLVQTNNATINFPNGAGVTLGQTGDNPHVFLTAINGQTPTAVLAANNNIIGGYAVLNGSDFASYTAGAGVVALGGVNGAPAYSANPLTAGVATDNISLNSTVQGVTSRTINSLAVRAPGAGTTVGLSDASVVLNFGTGGLLVNTAQTVLFQGGQLTAGGATAGPASLYDYTGTNVAGVQTINSQIVNNGANVVSLVRSGVGTLTLTPEIIDLVASVPAAGTTITVTNAQGLFVGMGVSGTNITGGSTITGIAGNVITLSAATGATVATNAQVVFAPPASTATSTTTAGTNTVTLGTVPAGFVPTIGMTIGGPNIAGGTTVTGVAGSTLTLSQPAIASSTTAVLTLGALSNTYTGQTVDNGGSSIFGLINVSGLPGSIVIPGDIVVGNATMTVTTQGNIAPTSNVTVASGGTFSLAAAGTNTLNSLTFTSNGSSGGQGNVATGTLLNLTAANAITSNNPDLGHTPFVAGTALALLNAAPVINTSGLSPDDLLISAPITAAGGQVMKNGTGSLVLSGASTFNTGLNVSQGSVIFGASSTGTPVTSGPIGTGTLTLSGGVAGSTVLSDGTARTIANAVSVTGNGFTFGGDTAGNNLILSGTVALTGTQTVNVTAATVTGTLTGIITNATGGITKDGAGILVITPPTSGSLTATNTVGSTLITLAAAPPNPLQVGEVVTGTNVPAGAFITSITDPQNFNINTPTVTTAPTAVTIGQFNNYTGPTTVANGVLKLGNAAAIPSSSDVTVNSGAQLDINGQASPVLHTIAGGGVITNSGAAQTLFVNGVTSGDTTSNLNSTFAGTITNAANALNLQVNGTGALTLTGINTYTGATTLKTGSLTGGATNSLSPNSPVIIGNGGVGAGSTNGVLSLGGFSQTIGGLTLQIDNATPYTLPIAAGTTLTISGNVLVGDNQAAAPAVATIETTKLTATGGGNLVVNGAAAFTVGGQTASVNNAANTAVVDLSGLSSVNIALNTGSGLLRVSNSSGNNVAGGQSTLILSPTNTITSSAIDVGDGSQFAGSASQVNALKLGSGTNVLNTNTLNIGTGGRDIGTFNFNGPTGTVVVNDVTGTGPVALNIATGAATTGVGGGTNIFDTTGHNATLNFGAVAIGTQPRASAVANVFSFDTGSLTMASLTASTKTGGVGTTTTTVNLGGTPADTTTITNGILQFGQITGTGVANEIGTAILNVTGGTVNIGATSGTSITMASAVALGTANATLNFTGGVTTLAGDIIKGGGAGTTTATFKIDGGTVDLTNHNIGSATLINTLTFASGTLKNVKEINAGGAIVKSTNGTLTLAGTNTYTGPTAINAGTLLVTGSTGATAITDNTGGTLGGNGTINGPVTLTSGSTVTGGTSSTDPTQTGTLTFTSTGLLKGGSAYNWKLSNTSQDLLKYTAAVASTLTIDPSATPAAPITVNIFGGSTALPTFDPLAVTQAMKAYQIAQVDPAAFTSLQTSFGSGTEFVTHDFTGLGSWQVALDSGTGNLFIPNSAATVASLGTPGIDVVFTPTPEPVVTGILGLVALALSRRPGRRQKEEQKIAA